MAFYDLDKNERIKIVEQINKDILSEIKNIKKEKTLGYFSDEDTYIRKSAYLTMGKNFKNNEKLEVKIIAKLNNLLKENDFKIRQTTINAAGEIGIKDFKIVEHFFDKGLFDKHHSVRNAVIGSIKKMGEQNPKPVLKWAKISSS